MKNHFKKECMNEAPTLAIVIPCFNEEEVLPSTLHALTSYLSQLVEANLISSQSYLCFVEDGSLDATWSILSDWCSSNKCISAIKLSKNFGHQNALLAGLLNVESRCDISISIDADLQQDHTCIVDFISHYKLGADVVFGVRRDRDSDTFLKRITAQTFYKLLSFLGVSVLPNHADYRLLSDRALKALALYKENDLFLRVICKELGFKSSIVYFNVTARTAGVSKYTASKMIKMAVNGITSFSVVPLRLIAIVGLFISVSAALMGLYVLIRVLFVGDAIPGWASIVLPIYLIGGVQILFLGIIGEYIGQVFKSVKSRPRFIIEKEL